MTAQSKHKSFDGRGQGIHPVASASLPESGQLPQQERVSHVKACWRSVANLMVKGRSEAFAAEKTFSMLLAEVSWQMLPARIIPLPATGMPQWPMRHGAGADLPTLPGACP
jgi:hypothetical protein